MFGGIQRGIGHYFTFVRWDAMQYGLGYVFWYTDFIWILILVV